MRHKTLVGFEGVFDPDWEADGPAIACANTYRLAKIDEYIEAINADTAEEWFRVIKRCAATRSTDKATFASFFEFLARLSAKRPDIMLGYLANVPEELVGFLHGILIALELSASTGCGSAHEALDQRRALPRADRPVPSACQSDAFTSHCLPLPQGHRHEGLRRGP